MSELHRIYRPADWDSVLGQDPVVRGVRSALDGGTSRSFLLVGPSGSGKTTVARLIASHVGCEVHNRLDIDAATHTGIDAMRSVAADADYRGLGASDVKVIIVDEAHGLSKQAWQSLLKAVEEPPEHVYWIFCTTEPDKIPKTIQTRCACFEFRSVPVDTLIDLLESVVKDKGWKTSDKVLATIARNSDGSPRRALTLLAAAYKAKTSKQALDLFGSADESEEAVALARGLVRGELTWAKAMKLLTTISDKSPESIRLVVLNYLAAVARNAKTDAQAGRALEMMDCFSEPYNLSERDAPLLLSLGRVLFGSDV